MSLEELAEYFYFYGQLPHRLMHEQQLAAAYPVPSMKKGGDNE